MKGVMGADIFVTMLLVFIIATGLLLMNSNKAETTMDKNPIAERNMPKINLPNGTSEGVLAPSATPKDSVTLTVQKNDGTIRYFIDNGSLTWEKLEGALRAKKVGAVKVRCDTHVSYGQFVQVLDLCRRAGVTEIYTVYIPAGREEG